jgi:alkanesulfonate monooxygenase SsuD/methylene tetrahydromethanopterin reductase-like flavin-dependent oxidoreductase (luciferase family)
MRFSAIVLPDHSPAEFLRTVRDIEAAGVERVWTYDHLSWHEIRGKPWFAAMPLLTAAATATSTIRLGPLVATPNFRHPVPFAKEVMTLDHLAGGRLDLGVGAGTDGPDAAVLGAEALTARQRADRFSDWVELLVALLQQDTVTATAGPYRAVDARMPPGCHQQPRPPLTVAAAGPRGMALAVRLAHTWVTYRDPRHPLDEGHDTWLDGLQRQSRTLDTVAAENRRRRPRAAAVIGLTNVAPWESEQRFDDTLGRLTEAGFDDLYALWPRPDGTGMPLGLVHHMLESQEQHSRSGAGAPMPP